MEDTIPQSGHVTGMEQACIRRLVKPLCIDKTAHQVLNLAHLCRSKLSKVRARIGQGFVLLFVDNQIDKLQSMESELQ